MPAPQDPVKYAEWVKNMSLSRKGRTSPMKGKNHSKETILKMKGHQPWNKGKKGEVKNPESRIRIWFQRLDQRIPRKKETSLMISEKVKGVKNGFYGKKHSDDSIKKMRNYRLGKTPWNKGVRGYKNGPSSQRRKELISLANKGRKRTKEFSELISKMKKERYANNPKSQPNYGKHHKKETCEKIREGNIGKTPWNKGKTGVYSKETLNRMRLAHNDEKYKQSMREKHKNWKIPFKDSKPERMMQIALALNGIKFEKHKSFKLGKSYHRVDIFIEPNICLEVDGIHWHLEDEDVKRDLFVNQELTIMGYHIIRIRDYDIIKNTQNCAETVIKLINELKYGVRLF